MNMNVFVAIQEVICQCFLGAIRNIGLVQDYINSSALAMELLQSHAKPSIWQCLLIHLIHSKDRYSRLATHNYILIVFVEKIGGK